MNQISEQPWETKIMNWLQHQLATTFRHSQIMLSNAVGEVSQTNGTELGRCISTCVCLCVCVIENETVTEEGWIWPSFDSQSSREFVIFILVNGPVTSEWRLERAELLNSFNCHCQRKQACNGIHGVSASVENVRTRAIKASWRWPSRSLQGELRWPGHVLCRGHIGSFSKRYGAELLPHIVMSLVRLKMLPLGSIAA